jgi:hypothetical protein
VLTAHWLELYLLACVLHCVGTHVKLRGMVQCMGHVKRHDTQRCLSTCTCARSSASQSWPQPPPGRHIPYTVRAISSRQTFATIHTRQEQM